VTQEADQPVELLPRVLSHSHSRPNQSRLARLQEESSLLVIAAAINVAVAINVAIAINAAIAAGAGDTAGAGVVEVALALDFDLDVKLVVALEVGELSVPLWDSPFFEKQITLQMCGTEIRSQKRDYQV
jgi:hypothetical protein